MMRFLGPFLLLVAVLGLPACAVEPRPRDGGWAPARGGYVGGGFGFSRPAPANHPGN